MKIGFIGLGIMGKPMAKNLMKAGHNLIVLDINHKPVEELTALGSESAETPAQIAAKTKVIITMLPNSPQVREAVLGENGVIYGATDGSVLIDMSSIAPLASREIAGKLAAKGVEMLDAPVSGGEPKAIEGTIAVMVGGKKEVFDANYDIMKTMAGSVVYVGETGAGNIAKLCNQVIV
jgi:2-hydroxy-3-oxopropionate reductase